MADLKRELKEMQRHYDAELKRLQNSYEARLRRLEARLEETDGKLPSRATEARETAAVTSAPVVAAVPAPAAPPPSGFALPPTAVAAPAPASSAAAFNPAIGVVLQGKGSAFSKNPNTYRVPGFALGDEAGPGRRGLSLDETEVNFQANVDPYLFGNLTVSLSPDNKISIKEAFLQTTSLPGGLTLRAGRFFSGIGYLNEQHSHTWDFADQALPYRVFLNTQYDDDGVQRWSTSASASRPAAIRRTTNFLSWRSAAGPGDSDLLALNPFRDIPIVTPATFVQGAAP